MFRSFPTSFRELKLQGTFKRCLRDFLAQAEHKYFKAYKLVPQTWPTSTNQKLESDYAFTVPTSMGQLSLALELDP